MKYTLRHTLFFIFLVLFTERACLQLAKANLGRPYFNVHFKLHVTGFFPLKQSILVMMVPMAVTVTQTASISDLAKIIVHVQQVIKETELCAQVRFVFSFCCWWGIVGADTLWFITGICGGKGRWKAS